MKPLLQPTENPIEEPTDEPTAEPSEDPTEEPTQQPTVAPTELCTTVQLTIANIGGSTDGVAVATYNGIYVKQASLVNDRDWWMHSTKSGDLGSSIYWSDASNRWIIEASDVTWEAPTTTFNPLDDDRHFPGLQTWFGAPPSVWQQLSSTTNLNGEVSVTFTCFDTGFPTAEPTEQPTDQLSLNNYICPELDPESVPN